MSAELLPWLASGGDFINQSINTLGGLYLGHQANQIEKNNLAFQQDAFSKSYQQQIAKFDYDKALQQRIFDREDTSIQRRVADLKEAGLSPMFAMGQGASAGSVVPTKAPQKQAPQRGIQGKLLQQAALRETANVAKTFAETKLILEQTDAMRATTNSKTAETARTEQLTAYEAKKFKYELDRMFHENEEFKKGMQHRLTILEYQKHTARHTNAIRWAERQLAEIDLAHKKELENWISSFMDKNNMPRLNPDQMKYAMAYVTYITAEHNREFAETWQVPTGGTNLYQLFMGWLKGVGQESGLENKTYQPTEFPRDDELIPSHRQR